MSGKIRILVVISSTLLLLSIHLHAWCSHEIRLVFTGDIMLSRNVKQEIDNRQISPWIHLNSWLQSPDLLFGNLEGAIGDSTSGNISPSSSMIFSVPSSYTRLIKRAGFNALSIENNHNMDLGPAGRDRTIHQLLTNGINPIGFENSPQFFKFEGTVIAVIAINLIPGQDSTCQKIPSFALSQKIRLAKNLANVVVVSIHWGSELLEWPNIDQRNAAQWLIHEGADIIIGHHPHVIQNPEIIEGKPVFYSLGNHVFDQKYPSTKEGLMVECIIKDSVLSYRCLRTHTAQNSFFPALEDSSCMYSGTLRIRKTIEVSGISIQALPSEGLSFGEYALLGVMDGKKIWQMPPMPLISIQVGRLDGKNDFILTLERHYSNVDREVGLRPYVYSVSRNGLTARWRGSALAWPLLDAIIDPRNEEILCAMHRKDSFISPNPLNKETRSAVYRWNGFGFSGVDDNVICKECEQLLK